MFTMTVQNYDTVPCVVVYDAIVNVCYAIQTLMTTVLGVSGTTSRKPAMSLTRVWCTKKSSMTRQFCRCGRARSLARSTGSNEGIGISSVRSNDTKTSRGPV